MDEMVDSVLGFVGRIIAFVVGTLAVCLLLGAGLASACISLFAMESSDTGISTFGAEVGVIVFVFVFFFGWLMYARK